MVKLKPITEHSWIVLTEDGIDRVGLLSEMQDRLVLIGGGSKKQFSTRQDVSNFFKTDVFKNLIEEEVTTNGVEYYIKGFKVDFPTPVEVNGAEVGSTLPLYAKSETSKIYFAAGYYTLKFPRGWQPANCPKYVTLQKYSYEGPFKTEQEMKSRLTELRRKQ